MRLELDDYRDSATKGTVDFLYRLSDLVKGLLSGWRLICHGLFLHGPPRKLTSKVYMPESTQGCNAHTYHEGYPCNVGSPGRTRRVPVQ